MPEYRGVDVEHPTIREYLKNLAKQRVEKERAMKIVGMPMEIVDKVYREAEREKK